MVCLYSRPFSPAAHVPKSELGRGRPNKAWRKYVLGIVHTPRMDGWMDWGSMGKHDVGKAGDVSVCSDDDLGGREVGYSM